MIQSIDPATGRVIESFEEMSRGEVDAILARVQEAWRSWRFASMAEREPLMKNAAEVRRRKKAAYARIMTLEMGTPIAQSEAEVEKCAWVCEYYAENASRLLAEEEVPTDAARSYLRFDPIGIVLAVMPWNFPFWQVFRFAAPALMAGNAGVLKHASNVMRCALSIEEVFREAGFPPDLFRALVIRSGPVAEIIADPRIAAVTLTGSEPAGSSVAEQAGRHLKKTVLELGGSDPFIVCADADVAKAASAAAAARLVNTGQSCIAAKRFIVVEAVAEEFEQAFVRELRARKVGDPLDPSTEVGAMARRDLLEDLDAQVRESVRLGARLLCGGKRMDRAGEFYEPTLLAGVTPGMPVYREETFGPVAALIRVKDEEEAIAVANDTPFGLGASLWTADREKAERLARRIEAGSVFVNGIVKSDPRLPFGGVKKSGYGRELSGYGIKEFVNIKTVWVD